MTSSVHTAKAQAPKRIRTCIGCGAQQGKMQLLRIVRTPQGPQLDASGRQPGRGAYVCGLACLEKAQKGGKLQRALKTQVAQEDYERLGVQIAQLAQAGASAMQQ